MGLYPFLFCLSFYLLYFVLPPFEDNGLPFWVPDVLCQHSEVVLWNLLSVQIFFRWICGWESGLPVLFLCHLRTAPLSCFQVWKIQNINLLLKEIARAHVFLNPFPCVPQFTPSVVSNYVLYCSLVYHFCDSFVSVSIFLNFPLNFPFFLTSKVIS